MDFMEDVARERELTRANRSRESALEAEAEMSAAEALAIANAYATEIGPLAATELLRLGHPRQRVLFAHHPEVRLGSWRSRMQVIVRSDVHGWYVGTVSGESYLDRQSNWCSSVRHFALLDDGLFAWVEGPSLGHGAWRNATQEEMDGALLAKGPAPRDVLEANLPEMRSVAAEFSAAVRRRTSQLWHSEQGYDYDLDAVRAGPLGLPGLDTLESYIPQVVRLVARAGD